MNYRLHAIKTIAIKRINETTVSPAFYVTLTACLLLGCYLVSDFVSMIGSDGPNPAKSQIYGLVFNMTKGIFGELFTNRLFAQGPFLFSLSFSFFGFVTYCGMSTVLQFGNEKGSGALEVIASGPADETCCFLGYFAVNVLATALFLCVTTLVYFAAALITNLDISASYFACLLFLFLGSIVVYAYCALASVLTRNAFSALAGFMVVLILFAGIQFGMYGTVSESGNIIAGTISYILQWVSPFFAINFGNEATQYGSIFSFVLGVIIPLAVGFFVLVGSHFISRKHGVRI